MLRIYNTLTRQKEEFKPSVEGEAAMYTCGPTVYNYATIGNFRSFIFEDILRRYLEYSGLRVRHIMNITDVGHLLDDADSGEDKLEAQARREKKDPWQIAEYYMAAFFEDAEKLRLKPAEHYPRATEHVAEMIEIIEKLIEKGHAYDVNGCVYFDVASFPGYGKLSGNTLEDLQAGARVEVNPDKKNPFDFALWVSDPRHIMKWDSPWGRGYPGWHIECTAMAMKYLGETIDIHCGGEDNVFPHHECEIAQSEAATGKPFVRYWMHARFLLVEGRKMSKSLGNFFTLRDLLEKGYDPASIRYVLLNTHYRQPLNFTFDGITAARESIRRLRDFARHMDIAASSGVDGENDDQAVNAAQEAEQRFRVAMDDDLNISEATAAVFDMVRDVNKLSPGARGAEAALNVLKGADSVLDVLMTEEKSAGPPDEEIEKLIAERNEARKNKNFARADEIRDYLLEKGIALEDAPDGTIWKRS